MTFIINTPLPFSASDPVTSVISTQLPYPVNISDGDPIVLTFEVINKVMNINNILLMNIFKVY